MWRLFGKSSGKADAKAAPAAARLSDASLKLELQVQSLEAKIARTDEEVRQLVAKSASNPTAKQRALQAMKKKKMYEEHRDRLLGTQFNLENLTFEQEQAEVTFTAVEAMRIAQEQLKQQQQSLNLSTVDKLIDDMAEHSDEMKAVNEALSRNTGVADADEEALNAEYARLEEEMAALALAGGAAAEPAEALPVTPPSVAAPAAASAPVAGTRERERARPG